MTLLLLAGRLKKEETMIQNLLITTTWTPHRHETNPADLALVRDGDRLYWEILGPFDRPLFRVEATLPLSLHDLREIDRLWTDAKARAVPVPVERYSEHSQE